MCFTLSSGAKENQTKYMLRMPCWTVARKLNTHAHTHAGAFQRNSERSYRSLNIHSGMLFAGVCVCVCARMCVLKNPLLFHERALPH
jgi:hypothetical protein